MKKLTKANSPQARLSFRGQLLLVPVCLAIAWLGFWAYAVLADVPATSIGTEADMLLRSSASDKVTTQIATVRIDPPAKTVGIGSTFTFDVWIDDVNNLGGFQFDLDYNSSIVHVDVSSPHYGADPGPFPGSTGRSVFELGPTVNNTTGYMIYGVYTAGSAPGPSGSGLLATIYFEAVDVGTSSLLLQHVTITDPNGNVLDLGPPQGGEVTVGEPEDFFVYLPIVLSNY